MVSRELLEFVRTLQTLSPCRLAGGAALSGVHLHHRLSKDLDLFCDSHDATREVAHRATQLARDLGGQFRFVRDGGTFVRGQLTLGEHVVEVDIAHEPSAPLASRDNVEGIVCDSLKDLHANKITCLLSRAEPRDLVDLYFLDRDQLTVEAALPAALEKDAGVDPAILSLLLKDFPTAPLPVMLKPLTEPELARFRNDLVDRLRAVALPSP